MEDFLLRQRRRRERLAELQACIPLYAGSAVVRLPDGSVSLLDASGRAVIVDSTENVTISASPRAGAIAAEKLDGSTKKGGRRPVIVRPGWR